MSNTKDIEKDGLMTNLISNYLKRPAETLIRAQRRWTSKIFRHISDGLFFSSIRFRVGAFKYHHLFPQAFRHAIARFMGDIGYLIGDLTRKSAWRVTGSDLQIVFVGSPKGCADVLPAFFDENASQEQIGQTSALRRSRKAKQWLQEGCDLVIFEQSRIFPFRPRASVSFAVPQWVNQMIEYPDDMNTFLAGPRYKKLRGDIHKASKAGCEWRFSRSREDFDYFYEHMYVPFTRARHGDQAHVAPYPLHWDLWIQKAGGGLVLVTQDGKTVAGDICLVRDGVCYDIEMGVLNGDESLLQQGINAFLSLAVIEWGKQQGAKFCNMGGSFGWRSNGAFRWKSRWGSQVARRHNPYRILSFAADRISEPLIEKVNSIGFVCETRKGFYGLMLAKEDTRLPENELDEMIARSRKQGLSGVCMLAPGAGLRFFDGKSA